MRIAGEGAIGNFHIKRDTTYLRSVPLYAKGFALTPIQLDEVRQTLRIHLMLRPHRSIALYGGRGSLKTWLRVLTKRAARIVATKEGRVQRERSRSLAGLSVLVEANPEDLVAKRQVRARLQVALKEGFSRLSSHERRLLHARFVEDQSAAQIADSLHVHRTTVIRWLKIARRRVSQAVRTQLYPSLAGSLADLHLLLTALHDDFPLDADALLAPPCVPLPHSPSQSGALMVAKGQAVLNIGERADTTDLPGGCDPPASKNETSTKPASIMRQGCST